MVLRAIQAGKCASGDGTYPSADISCHSDAAMPDDDRAGRALSWNQLAEPWTNEG